MKPQCLTCAALFVLTFSFTVSAQNFPSKTLRFIVPVPPGGANDTLTRAIAPPLATALGRQVIVDNRPGANTTAGTDALAKSPPDGHTLLMAPSAHTVNASLYKSLPYDPIKDFETVALVAQTPLLLATHPSLPSKTVKEFVSLARQRPGELNYASAGNGTSGHLAAELLASVAKVRINHIPYKGGAPAVVDLIGGHVQFMFPTLQSGMAHVNTGKLRGMAVTSTRRSTLANTIPTMAEQGLSAVEIVSWYGVLVPAGVPKDIVTKLNDEIRKILDVQQVRERLVALGYENYYSSSEDFSAFLKTDLAKWSKVIRESGIRAE